MKIITLHLNIAQNYSLELPVPQQKSSQGEKKQADLDVDTPRPSHHQQTIQQHDFPDIFL